MSPTVFISHAHEEATLAERLRTQLEGIFGKGEPRIEFFESNQIDPGGLWMDTLNRASLNTKVALVLVSEESVRAPWENFETGRLWNCKVIPVCHSGFSPVRLSGTPLSVCQALFTGHTGWFKRLVCYLEKEMGWNTSNPFMTDDALLDAEENIRSVEALLIRRSVQPVGSRTAFVFKRGDDLKCLEAMEGELSRCKVLSFFGIELHFFRRDVVLDIFCDRVLRGDLRARVAMADRDSGSVQHRLRVEYSAVPPNPEHVRYRLEDLQNRVRDFEFRLFNEPPPYALMIFDDVVFTHCYGLRTPGDQFPTFCIQADKAVLGFYDEQFDMLWGTSAPVPRRAAKFID
jgi:hypothetical protein